MVDWFFSYQFRTSDTAGITFSPLIGFHNTVFYMYVRIDNILPDLFVQNVFLWLKRQWTVFSPVLSWGLFLPDEKKKKKKKKKRFQFSEWGTILHFSHEHWSYESVFSSPSSLIALFMIYVGTCIFLTFITDHIVYDLCRNLYFPHLQWSWNLLLPMDESVFSPNL